MSKINSLHLNQPDFSQLIAITAGLGEEILKEMGKDLRVEQKEGSELVSRIDLLIEKRAREQIRKIFGNVNIHGEEYGTDDAGSAYTFIVDPIDGTESFINTEYNCAISIGVECDGKIIYGVVYDFMRDLIYVGGEWTESQILKNGNIPMPIQRENFSNRLRLLLSGEEKETQRLQGILQQDKRLRVQNGFGSVSLQSVLTGSGAFHGYVRTGRMRKWDISGPLGFLKGFPDIEVYSRDGGEFNHNNPGTGIIMAQKKFSRILLSRLEKAGSLS